MYRELTIFLVVGSLTVAVDFLTYRSLLWLHLFDLSIAKAVGFLIGTVFAYVVNRAWTFGHQAHAVGSLFRFVLLYTATLMANVLINDSVFHWIQNTPWGLQWAFFTATAISAMLNFVGMKWFAFKASYKNLREMR